MLNKDIKQHKYYFVKVNYMQKHVRNINNSPGLYGMCIDTNELDLFPKIFSNSVVIYLINIYCASIIFKLQ